MHCPAIFRNNVLFISVGRFAAQIAVNEIQSMWDALTHYPDRRARLELEELAERINSFATYAQELAAGGGELGRPKRPGASSAGMSR